MTTVQPGTMTTVQIPTCARCATMTFPPQLRCRKCGAVDWTVTPVDRGELEAVTVVERSLVAATRVHPSVGIVRVEGGVRIVVRVRGEAAAGAKVALSADGNVVVATPL